MRTADQITIDMHLEMIKDDRYTAEGRADAQAYINYLKENGTDSQKEYIKSKTKNMMNDYYHGGGTL